MAAPMPNMTGGAATATSGDARGSAESGNSGGATIYFGNRGNTATNYIPWIIAGVVTLGAIAVYSKSGK